MNRLSLYLIFLFFACASGSVLLSCKNWDLPGEKSKRACTKPSGTLTVQAQQRKIDAAITNSSGTIDRVDWDFGNGSTTVTTGLTVSYTYEKEGTYTVKATLSNTCTDRVTLQQTVSASNPVVPGVTLQPVSGVSTGSATVAMSVTNTGNATVTKYGIYWSATNQTPTVKDQKSEVSGSPAVNVSYPFSLTGLLPNTRYYVRAFAINSVETGYSAPTQSFVTGQDPAVNTVAATNVSIATATANFMVTTAGNPAAVEYGICYSSNTSTPDVTNALVRAVSPAPVGPTVPVNLVDLTANKTYYYRAYAKTATGEVVYGDIMSFTTQVDLLARDLIASVSFNDRSLLDVSGNNNHVKLVGNPTFTTDHKGERANSAIVLNGTGDYFYMPENSTLNPTTDFTISVWIRPSSFAGRTREDNNRMQIYNKSTFSTGQNELFSSLIKLKDDVGPELTFSTDVKQNSACQPGKGWQTFQFTSPAETNTWYHLVFTYSGRSIRMYFNGVLQRTQDNLPNDRLDACPGGDLKFGAQYSQLPWYFGGAMDDIRIYKRSLSADEVQTLFKQ